MTRKRSRPRGPELGQSDQVALPFVSWYLPASIAAESTAPDFATLIRLVEDGVPTQALHELVASSARTAGERAALIQRLAPSLITRATEGHLPSDESDRVVRFARILATATATGLRTRDDLAGFLFARDPKFGGRAPVDLLDSDPGVQLLHYSLTSFTVIYLPSVDKLRLSPRG